VAWGLSKKPRQKVSEQIKLYLSLVFCSKLFFFYSHQ
jgi:hypothetical protein